MRYEEAFKGRCWMNARWLKKGGAHFVKHLSFTITFISKVANDFANNEEYVLDPPPPLSAFSITASKVMPWYAYNLYTIAKHPG